MFIVRHIFYALPSMHFHHTQVESEWESGNRYRAQNASQLARRWGIAGIVIGIFLSVGSFVVALVSYLLSY